MAIKIVYSNNDEDFAEISDMFYNNFNPDDWDYVIIGEDRREVDDMAYKLQVCDYEIKEVKITDPMTNWIVDTWVAVTYHS
jgi:hypothetical protein